MLIQFIVGSITFFLVLFLCWSFLSRHRRNLYKTEKQIVVSKDADTNCLVKFLLVVLPIAALGTTFFIDFFWFSKNIDLPIYTLLNDNGLFMLLLIATWGFVSYHAITLVNNMAHSSEEKNNSKKEKIKHRIKRNSDMSQQLLYITSYLITIGISILFILFFTTNQKYFLDYALK